MTKAVYLDSCILVKLVVNEPDSAYYHGLLVGQPLATSELAWTEVQSALLSKELHGFLRESDRKAAWDQFTLLSDRGELILLPLDRRVLVLAGRLIERCRPEIALRTLDAIHVATAQLHFEPPLCSNDPRVRHAATRIGLELSPLPST